ncbi:hypothetical protein [Paenibacillus sp. Soil522]|uniref:hypothetical protein n=1 Tax=Paenibacillus sp. Soil522 TaxID=1736388 RepID=UPI0006FE55D8|nr:hypothetical protein [Paenibacillus sp. Soil522]KRE44983.1 hypothetical protein ASG81_14990 [Paenibacillus sp. Soil522]
MGLDNLTFFHRSGLAGVTLNTIYLNLLFIVSGTVCSLCIALLLNEIHHSLFKKVTQSLVILPHFISIIVVNLMVMNFFNGQDGMINRSLKEFGFQTISWFQTPEVWPWLLTVIFIWKGAGGTDYLSCNFNGFLRGIL